MSESDRDRARRVGHALARVREVMSAVNPDWPEPYGDRLTVAVRADGRIVLRVHRGKPVERGQLFAAGDGEALYMLTPGDAPAWQAHVLEQVGDGADGMIRRVFDDNGLVEGTIETDLSPN